MLSNVARFFEGEDGSYNLESFRLMNSAMFMQIWHSKNDKIKEIITNKDFSAFSASFYSKADAKLYDGKNVAWRPFQLAFILLNLDGIFCAEDDKEWNSRNGLVDLVWFPTGGGKTEAYLGIIALTIINRRRLHDGEGGGTAVLMRYTLRLLTLQQFQRATLVIMALELIRRWKKYNLGEEPIYIGLWVGDTSLPNKAKGLLEEFDKLNRKQDSKVPFDCCPWCKSDLQPATVVNSSKNDVYNFNRVHLLCSNSQCSFSVPKFGSKREDQGPIPVSLCDEEIYQHPPALLFGTVDKFASLAHKVDNGVNQGKDDSRRIFGRGKWEQGKPKRGYLPPDLIIQDELHLLLGPLGSAVALFECAIDQLCRREDGTRPKIISSTATTRNTDLQIMALFDREVL